MHRILATSLVLCLSTLAARAESDTVGVAAGDPVAGQAAYASACSRCHRDADRLLRRIGAATPEALTAALEAKLARHHAGDPQLRADITAWLLSLD